MHPESSSGPVLPVAVARTADWLQNNYLGFGHEGSSANAKATLAQLRRCAGEEPLRNPLAFEMVLELLRPKLTPQEQGSGDKPSPSEQAAFHALTLFAMHMQSATGPVHDDDRTFGQACGILRAAHNSESIKPRFDSLLLARESGSRLYHARTLISLLRGKKISFDYGRFARDLRNLQNPSYRDGVLLRWARDFTNAAYQASNSVPADAE